MTEKLRIHDVSGDDWDWRFPRLPPPGTVVIGPEFAREPGESIEDWIDRVQDIVIDTIPDCGGYDDDGPVTARRASGAPQEVFNAYAAVVVEVIDERGNVLATRTVVVDKGDEPENDGPEPDFTETTIANLNEEDGLE